MVFTYSVGTAPTREAIERAIEQTLASRAAQGVKEAVIAISVTQKKAWKRGVHSSPASFSATITSEV